MLVMSLHNHSQIKYKHITFALHKFCTYSKMSSVMTLTVLIPLAATLAGTMQLTGA